MEKRSCWYLRWAAQEAWFMLESSAGSLYGYQINLISLGCLHWRTYRWQCLRLRVSWMNLKSGHQYRPIGYGDDVDSSRQRSGISSKGDKIITNICGLIGEDFNWRSAHPLYTAVAANVADEKRFAGNQALSDAICASIWPLFFTLLGVTGEELLMAEVSTPSRLRLLLVIRQTLLWQELRRRTWNASAGSDTGFATNKRE